MMKHIGRLLVCSFLSSTLLWAGPGVWNLPPQNPSFTDRDTFFGEVKEILQNKAPLCVITGGPGFGKSQFVKEYAHRSAEAYQVIWWFDINQTLLQQFVLLAQALNTILPPHSQIRLQGLPPEKVIANMKEVLRKHPIKCLFIFDNADTIENIADYIPLSQDNYLSVLVTSRKKSTVYPSLKLGPFNAPDSAVLVQKVLPKERKEDQMKLINTLYGHPLALATALTAIHIHPSVCIASYLKDREKQKAYALEQGIKIDQYENSIDTALKISLEAMAKTSPDAARVTRLLTFFAPTQIPFSYLKAYVKAKKSKQTADQLLKIICDQSLLEVTQKFDPHKKMNTKKNVRLSIHELVHQVIHQQIPDFEKRALLLDAIAMVNSAFKGINDLVVQKILREPEHLMHAERVLAEAKRLNYHSIPLLSLQIRVLDCIACGQRDFEKARPLIEDIHATQKHLEESHTKLPVDNIVPLAPSLDPRDEALLEILLGITESAAYSDADKAMAHFEKAMQILEKIPGEEAQQLHFRALINLLNRCSMRGKIDKAITLIETGKKLLAQSKIDLTNAYFVSNWALLLLQQGQIQESITCLEQHASLLVCLKDYPMLKIHLLCRKAKAFLKLEKKIACDEVLDQVQKLVDDFFDDRVTPLKDDIKILRILNHIDQSTREMISEIKQIIQHYNVFWKGEKKQTYQAYAYFALGRVYEHLGDLNPGDQPGMNEDYFQASEMYKKSHAIYKALLKELKIDDVSELWAAMAILGRKRGDPEGQFFKDKHIDLFEITHPRSDQILTDSMNAHMDGKTQFGPVRSSD